VNYYEPSFSLNVIKPIF